MTANVSSRANACWPCSKSRSSHGQNAEVTEHLRRLRVQCHGSTRVGIYLWHRAIALNPKAAQYRINLIKVLIALDREDEAREEIVSLRRLGRLGQNEAAAETMEARLQLSLHTPPPRP